MRIAEDLVQLLDLPVLGVISQNQKKSVSFLTTLRQFFSKETKVKQANSTHPFFVK